MLRMIRPTLSTFFGQIFVDTYLLSHWQLDFPCAASKRKDASGRPSLNEPIMFYPSRPRPIYNFTKNLNATGREVGGDRNWD